MTEQQKEQIAEIRDELQQADMHWLANCLDYILAQQETPDAEAVVDAIADGVDELDDETLDAIEADNEAMLRAAAQQETPSPERTPCACRSALKKILLWSQLEHTCGDNEGPCLPCNVTATAYRALALPCPCNSRTGSFPR